MNKIIIFAFLAGLCLPVVAVAADLKSEAIYRASLGRTDDVKLLLDQGASADLTNEDGVPLLALASARKDEEGIKVVAMLLEKGANVNGTDKQGQTALFYAAKQGNMDIVKYLLEKQINYYATDKRGEIARTIAHQEGHDDIVKAMDDFVTGKTADVAKQYDDVNKTLTERYKQEQEDALKATEEARKAAEEQRAAAEAARKEAQEQTKQMLDATQAKNEAIKSAQDANVQALVDLRNSDQYKKDMYDLAFHNCAYQYWFTCQSKQQTSELTPDNLDIAIHVRKDQVAAQTQSVMDNYQLDQGFVDDISANAKRRIFNIIEAMPSNTYRHEQGIGEVADMKKRCELIARSWDQQAQALVRSKVSAAQGRSKGGIKKSGGKKGKAKAKSGGKGGKAAAQGGGGKKGGGKKGGGKKGGGGKGGGGKGGGNLAPDAAPAPSQSAPATPATKNIF